MHWLSRESSGHGVPEVMEAVALHGGRIRPRVIWMKTLTSCLCIGTGGSAGPEGPIVQIGSAVGSGLGQILQVRPERMRLLVACGAASGLAATFNAPLAGVLFATEVILGHWAISTLSPLIVASVAGTFVAHSVPAVTGGDVRIFEIPAAFEIVSAWEIPLYALLGLACAAVGLAFVKALYAAEDFFRALLIPRWLQPAIGGLLAGALTLASIHGLGGGYVHGAGYQAAEQAIRGNVGALVLLAAVAAKIAATSLTLGSGGSGGVFAPGLVLGAMTGGAFGATANALFPSVTAPAGAYAVVGMGAVLAGTMHAPITAILILFEMTGTYSIILPIMTACIVASLAASRAKGESIYTEKLKRRGVSLSHGLEASILGSARVRDVMEAGVQTLPEGAPLRGVLDHFLQTQAPQVYVLDPDGGLRGIVHMHDVKAMIADRKTEEGFIASDVMRTRFPNLSPDAPLTEAFKAFGPSAFEEIPVIGDVEGRPRFLGVVTRQALFRYYDREVLRQGALGLKVVSSTPEGERDQYLWMPEGHEVRPVRVPPAMAGRTLRDLDLRRRFRVNVVGIRGRNPDLARDTDVPSPERVLEEGETLLAAGRREDLEGLAREFGGEPAAPEAPGPPGRRA
jgi:CIC family chloride channel protein